MTFEIPVGFPQKWIDKEVFEKMEKLRQDERTNRWLEPDVSSAIHEKSLFLAGLRSSWIDPETGKERAYR